MAKPLINGPPGSKVKSNAFDTLTGIIEHGIDSVMNHRRRPGDSRNSSQPHLHHRITFSVLLTIFLGFKKPESPVPTWHIAGQPRPSCYGQPAAGAGQAREAPAPKAGSDAHNPDAEARPTASERAPEERLVKPRGALKARRRRGRSRLRDSVRWARRRLRNPLRPRSPQRSSRRTMRRPGADEPGR